MNIKVTGRLVMLISALVLSGALLTSKSDSSSDSSQEQNFTRLVLEVRANKDSYVLGEMVTLKFKVTNPSDKPISIDENSDVYTGLLRVLVAYESGDYKSYLGPRWSVKDVGVSMLKLNPGESYQTEATMLCNPVVETSHLNETAAKQAIKDANYVEGMYALSRPGAYYIRAVLHDTDSNDKIESEPIRIVADEPLGDDLQIWEVIKSNREYGYFIQNGHLNEAPDGHKTVQISGTLQHILDSHPNSRYAAMINQGFSKHRSLVEKLNRVSNRPNN